MIFFYIFSRFHYSTLAYTLLSAVLEKVDGRPFPEQLQELLEKLELRNTHLDTEKARVVSNRARYTEWHTNKIYKARLMYKVRNRKSYL